ncbi:HAMP domain-containing sensor histidine kinase [uncultured Aquabacterium sp.]|jgi:signal transduction histidine kinase|uniref:sensor histidine kinase n=1 Tax=uncultured Aquabacterium sp. TaxID=158753 RepID=UPI00262A3BDF|nr:HAMP domain-containing sensor histidine kinase [uncultured Aquabacterium sp.]
MKTLALRIYLAVVAVLLIFALVSGWLAQRNLEHQREQLQTRAFHAERAAAWAELLENSLPPITAPIDEQANALLDWSERLRMPMALDDARGERLATSPLLADILRRAPDMRGRLQQSRLSDGRTLWMLRPGALRLRVLPGGMGPPPPPGMGHGAEGPPPFAREASPGEPRGAPHGGWWSDFPPAFLPLWLVEGVPALITSLVLLFIAVAVGAWPVANRLTRRLKALRDGVEAFGSGQLQHRVTVEGRDEVAALAASFNDTAQRIEDLVTANRSLLANASHELRSPLARLKMAVSIMADMPPERAAQIKEEIHQDIRELDALVEEVLLASRLDARTDIERQPVDLLGLAIEEARRVNAEVSPVQVPAHSYPGDERLLRRAVRNLLENARRYGGPDIELELDAQPRFVELRVCDRGPGVPPEQRDRIFEPFYRLPGHAEYAGGVGLGLSLVRQIAERHGGKVRCEARQGGGSCFVIHLPVTN